MLSGEVLAKTHAPVPVRPHPCHLESDLVVERKYANEAARAAHRQPGDKAGQVGGPGRAVLEASGPNRPLGVQQDGRAQGALPPADVWKWLSEVLPSPTSLVPRDEHRTRL
jgi:hypothetical protein